MTIQGIDVSHYQGDIDWQKVAAPGVVKFAYAKASEGIDNTDPSFSTNFAGMLDAGLLRGAYHFFHPEYAAADQAAHFLNVLGTPRAGDLPPMLDLETDGGLEGPAIVARALQWLDQVQMAVKCTPIVYCSPNFWTNVLGSPSDLTEFRFWIADYKAGDAPVLPPGVADYTFWQYTANGALDGIAVPVLLDRFNGSLDALRAMGAS